MNLKLTPVSADLFSEGYCTSPVIMTHWKSMSDTGTAPAFEDEPLVPVRLVKELPYTSSIPEERIHEAVRKVVERQLAKEREAAGNGES